MEHIKDCLASYTMSDCAGDIERSRSFGEQDPFEIEETNLSKPMPKRGFQKAIDFLMDLGVEYKVLSEYHIRIRWINYYPTKHTVYCDGAKGKYKGRGLDFLKEVLIKEGIL